MGESRDMKGAPQGRMSERSGIIAGFCCYLLWGIMPLYWKLLDDTSPWEVIAQRVIWCFVFTAIVCKIAGWHFIPLFRDSRARRFLIPASILITINWSLYIFAVSIDRIVETALGYYINPIITILLGLIVFREKLPLLQWIAVGLCCFGIGFFTLNYGSVPWISILLALSFGAYGAVKKRGGYPAAEAIAVESAYMVPVALAVSAGLALTGQGAFLADTASAEGWITTLLLIGGGLCTMVPLVLFAKAANSIPLTLLGFLQYLSPTCGLIIGVFVNGEPFTLAHGVCFGCIWCGLALVGIGAIIDGRTNGERAISAKAGGRHPEDV